MEEKRIAEKLLFWRTKFKVRRSMGSTELLSALQSILLGLKHTVNPFDKL